MCPETSSSGGARTSRPDDHQSLSAAEVQRVQRQLERTLDRRTSQSTLQLQATPNVSVPLHAHVVDGLKFAGPTRSEVLTQLEVLNAAYRGEQVPASGADSGVDFVLSSFQRVQNQKWLEADMFERAERRMRRELHRGGPRALNVYFTRPRAQFGEQAALGWSSFPWRVRERPKLDGVTINVDSMAGGAARGYNQGDTLVHEAGHWLGLFHTFEGRCGKTNDLVRDTPKERDPSLRCKQADTCAAPGSDPVHNFMDYSYDSCMYEFTSGQVSRMNENWLAFRAPR